MAEWPPGNEEGDLERLRFCLKRRVLMGHARSLWILMASQSLRRLVGGRNKERICGMHKEEERESDKVSTRSVPSATGHTTQRAPSTPYLAPG